jgi:DNA mismatch repair ATPase MutL
MSQNILFFSQNCQHSKQLINKIINTPLYQTLQKVCVDDAQTRARLPKWVTCVPLIYLSQPHPTLQNPLKDKEIWMWVEQQISQTQMKMQPPQQQFQQQQQQQNMNQQQQFQQQAQQQQFQQPPQQQQPQQSQQPQQQQNQGGMANDFLGLTPFNSLEMGSGIASDNYSMFSKDDTQSSLNSFFPHSYEIIGGNNGNNGPNPPPQQQSQSFAPPQPSFSGGNGGNSRSEQKQSAFEQEFAMKKAMRDQDGMGQQPARKVDGLPQNFNQMWEQGRK